MLVTCDVASSCQAALCVYRGRQRTKTLFNHLDFCYFVICLSPEGSNADEKETRQPQDGKTEDDDIPDNNNNEEKHARDDEEKAAVETDETAGADDKSLVSADVIQLLDSIIERIGE